MILSAGASDGCVVGVTAATLAGDDLASQAAADAIAVPLLSFFCPCGSWLALAPLWPGEATSREATLRKCHLLDRLAVCLVFVVNFVQVIALAFTHALGAWGDLRAPSFSLSFLLVAPSALATRMQRACSAFAGSNQEKKDAKRKANLLNGRFERGAA